MDDDKNFDRLMRLAVASNNRKWEAHEQWRAIEPAAVAELKKRKKKEYRVGPYLLKIERGSAARCHAHNQDLPSDGYADYLKIRKV